MPVLFSTLMEGKQLGLTKFSKSDFEYLTLKPMALNIYLASEEDTSVGHSTKKCCKTQAKS